MPDPAGWIPAYRRLFDPDHWLAPSKRDPSSRRDAWLDLCQMATWQPRETRSSGTIGRGELVVSIRTLAKRWGWHRCRVERFMSELRTRTATETVRETPDGTVYRIVNYDTYAVSQNGDRDTQRDSKRDSGETAARQEQEVKHLRRTEIPPEVGEVFAYWCSERKRVLNLNGGPPPVLSDSRASKIRARIKEGYDVAALKRAVDGCLASDFHVSKGYTDIELICRDQKRVEQFLLASKDQRAKAVPTEGGGFYAG